MKAQTPAEGILKTNDWGYSKMYKVVCQCGDTRHDITFDVEANDTDVCVTSYTVQYTDSWTQSVKERFDIDNYWLQEFDWTWKGWWNKLVSRLRMTKQIWWDGEVKFEATTIMSEQQALNYAETLKAAIEDVKTFKEANK